MGTGNPRFLVKGILSVSAAGILSACATTEAGVSSNARSTDELLSQTITTDIAAPEAFSIQDKALWDGRPTFGGVWLAYPGIDTPERVRITNPENGSTVIGALYKREDGFPGPNIELSADAASALGVLAGVPTELNIVALRRQEVVVEVPQDEIQVGIFGAPVRRPGTEPVAVAVEDPVAETPAADTETLVAAVEAAVAIETPAVEATALPPVAAQPAAATPTEVQEAAPVPVAAPVDPNSSYIQVATFQSEKRAEDLIRRLEIAGLSSEIRETTGGSRTHYRVIAGPATSPEMLEIMLSVVKELGYTDAIPLR